MLYFIEKEEGFFLSIKRSIFNPFFLFRMYLSGAAVIAYDDALPRLVTRTPPLRPNTHLLSIVLCLFVPQQVPPQSRTEMLCRAPLHTRHRSCRVIRACSLPAVLSTVIGRQASLTRDRGGTQFDFSVFVIIY
jgi:hypothetical protein